MRRQWRTRYCQSLSGVLQQSIVFARDIRKAGTGERKWNYGSIFCFLEDSEILLFDSQHYLSDMPASLHQSMRLRGLLQPKDLEDIRPKLSFLDQRPDAPLYAGIQRALESGQSAPKGAAGDREPAHHNVQHIEFSPGTVHRTYKHKSAIRPQYPQILRYVVSAHHIEDHVHPVVLKHGLEVFIAIVDDQFGTCLLTGTAFLFVARGRKRLSSHQMSELDRRESDSAAAAVDEKALSGYQPPTLKHIVPNGKHCFGQCRCFRKAQSSRYGKTMPAVHRYILSITAAWKERTHSLSDLPSPCIHTDGFNQPCDFDSGTVDRRTRRGRVVPLPLHQISAIPPSGFHTDQDICFPQARLGSLLDLKHLGFARNRNNGCVHGAP